MTALTKYDIHIQSDWSLLDGEDLSQIFRFGSVLRVKRSWGYYHVGVYLGGHTVIHIHSDKVQANQRQKIFVIDTISNFAGKDHEIQEFQFLIPTYSKKELYDKALEMSKKKYLYSVAKNNCEHLAFELVTGMKHSFQTEGFFSRLFAHFADTFKVGLSVSNASRA